MNSMRKTITFSLIFLCLTGLILRSQTVVDTPDTPLAADSLGATSSQEDSLFYSADSIYYDQSQEKIYLFGNTGVRYQDSSIDSDSLELDLDKERAYSNGFTVLRDGQQILLGRNVRFDIGSQEGIIQAGSSSIEKSFYRGEEIRKVGGDVYDVDHAHFTTCDHLEPCFHFSSAQLRVYRGDKIVGRPVIAYVNDFPVFYFPFFTIPIRKGRHAGFLIPQPGYNSYRGKYIEDIAWYYPYKDFADFTISLDLFEKTGWRAGLKSQYTQRYKYNGSFSATYSHEIQDNQRTRDWALVANHHHELGERSTIDANIDFVTNKRIWDSSDDLYESLAQRLSSSVSYRKPLLSSYLNVGASYTQDLINDRVYLTLPSASFSIPSRPVYELFYKPERAPDSWWANFVWNYSVRMDHNGSVNDPSPSLQDLLWSNRINPIDSSLITQHNIGINHRMGLSYNWKLRGWLNFRQGLDYNESWYDRDRNDVAWVRGSNYSAYFNSSFNLYGTKNFTDSYIHSIRHILTPSLGVNYSPDFSDNVRFYSFGGISTSSSGESANLSFGIDQKWQLKYGRGEGINIKRITDLLSWSSRINANLMEDNKRFGNISHNLALKPGNLSLGDFKLNDNGFVLKGLKLSYNNNYSFIQNPYKVHWDDLSLRNHYFSQSITLSGSAPYATYFPKAKNDLFAEYQAQDSLGTNTAETAAESSDSWNLSIEHRLSGAKSLFDPSGHDLRLTAGFSLSRNWGVSYNNYYNLETKEMISQSFKLSRNLHCWKLEISYTRRNNYWDYRLILFNTVLPDALKFQTRDSGYN